MSCPRHEALRRGERPPEELDAAAVSAHLFACAECRDLASLEATSAGGPVIGPLPGAVTVPAHGSSRVQSHGFAETHLMAGATPAPARGDRGPDDAPDRAPAVLPVVHAALYVKEAELGAGGMGCTYRARERRLDRVVALKQIRADTGVDAEVLEAAFEREARLTARLQHPSIVAIYEAGRFAPSNAPFYAMRLVDGVPLDQEIAKAPDLAARLALVPHMATVCLAIAYAHDQRIVHRDLKPANIVLGKFGEAVVIDWGVACDLDEESAKVRGTLVGTPAYMPPEQAAGDLPDPRSDVYALGATLYHVLAGHSPYADQSPAQRTREGARPTPLSVLQPRVPKDLLAIVDTALAADRDDRYASAQALADDLGKFLGGRLVTAYEYTRAERLRRWLARNRLPVAIATLALLAFLIGGALSLRRILAERQRADDARDVAIARADELVLRRAGDLLSTDPTAALALVAQYPADGPKLDEARMVAAEASSRGVAQHVLGGHTHAVADVAVSPDSRTIASVGVDGSVWRWDAATGSGSALVVEGPAAQRAAFATDGSLAVGFADGAVRVWGPTGAPRAELSAGGERVRALVWARDGRTLVAGGDGGRARVWTVEPAPAPVGAPREIDAGGEIFDLQLSPDDSTLALGGRGKTVRLWNRVTGATHELPAGDGAMRLAWAPSGERIAAGGRDGKTRVWSASTGELVTTLDDGGVVRGVVWSADGARLATAGTAPAIHVWTLGTDGAADERVDLVGHVEPVSDLALARDGSLVSASHDHSVRVWDLGSGASRVLAGHRDQVTRLALAPSGAFVVSASKDHAVRVWPQRREHADMLRIPEAIASDVAWSPDSATVASTWDDSITRVWAPGHPAPPRELVGDAPARAVAFDPTGRSLAWVGGGHDVFIADVAGGEPRRLAGHTAEAFALAWTPDGRLVTGGLDKSVLTWDREGASRGIHAHGGGVWSVAISPDGTRAATAGFDGTLALTPLDGSAPAQVRVAHRDGINAVAWSPDGAQVATGSVDESIHIWRAADDTASRKLDAHRTVTALAWGPDSAHLASAAHDGVIRWWDVGAGTDRVVARHHGAAVAVAVSRDGHLLASGGLDGDVWLIDLAADTARVFATPGPITHVRFSPDGKHLAAAGAAVTVWDVGGAAPALATTTAQLSEAGDLWTPR